MFLLMGRVFRLFYRGKSGLSWGLDRPQTLQRTTGGIPGRVMTDECSPRTVGDGRFDTDPLPFEFLNNGCFLCFKETGQDHPALVIENRVVQKAVDDGIGKVTAQEIRRPLGEVISLSPDDPDMVFLTVQSHIPHGCLDSERIPIDGKNTLGAKFRTRKGKDSCSGSKIDDPLRARLLVDPPECTKTVPGGVMKTRSKYHRWIQRDAQVILRGGHRLPWRRKKQLSHPKRADFITALPITVVHREPVDEMKGGIIVEYRLNHVVSLLGKKDKRMVSLPPNPDVFAGKIPLGTVYWTVDLVDMQRVVWDHVYTSLPVFRRRLMG